MSFRDLPVSTPLLSSDRVRMYAALSDFYLNARGPNAGLHVYLASTLLMSHFPGPSVTFLMDALETQRGN